MCNRHPRNGSNCVIAVAFNPKNPGQLASASEDNTVKIWNLEDGQCQQTLQGHSWDVNAVAWSPDGKLIASGSFDTTVRVWSAEDGSCAKVLSGHRYATNAIPCMYQP